MRKVTIHFPSGELKASDLIHAQERIIDLLNELGMKPGNFADLLENIALDSSKTTLVPHKLGRRFIDYHVGKKNANADVWFDSSSTADLTKYLPLKCDTDVTVNIEVY